jgi:hypothetical protein
MRRTRPQSTWRFSRAALQITERARQPRPISSEIDEACLQRFQRPGSRKRAERTPEFVAMVRYDSPWEELTYLSDRTWRVAFFKQKV